MNEKMLVFQVLLLTVVTTLAVKNIDEDHPYEFGFTIDGQQHRHEKKDDKGIIQGEFGFITADGIYHVTVYATDENGDFKILSMRNLRISAPLDGSPFKGEISPEANKYRKQANLPLLPQPNPLSLPGNGVSNTKEEEKITIQSSVRPEIAATTEKVNKFTTQSTIRPACASCGLISTPKPQPVQPFVYQNTANGQIAPNTNVNQPTVDKENGQQPIGSGGPSITNLPPAYQAVSGPQSTNYNTFGSQEHNKQPEIGNLQNPLVNLGVGAPNTQSDNNAGGHISNTGVGVNEYKGNEQEGPGSQLGNTNGQYSNVGGDPTNSGLGDYSQQGQTPVNVENGQESPSQFGNSGPSGPYTNNASPGGELSNGGLGVNVREQSPNVQVSNGQSGNGGPANQQGNIQSGPGLGPAGQSGAPEPNPLQLPIGGQGANAPSTLPPISVSDGFIHVGGDKKQDIPIKDKFPGMEDGLPAGIDEKDITNLLYKFHYTVGFHGHYEKGLKNGAKIGGYFVNGRDGISRIVTYIADENGYRPKVKFINLGLESDDTPKPETEKTFGLKSFEFVWYPL